MKHAYRFAFTAAFCALLPLGAWATTVSVANPPVAKPMSAWLVGPSQVSSFDTSESGKGCLMVTEYNNGIIVGLHAREEGIVGMTLDMRGAVNLIPGQGKQIGLNIGTDSYVVEAHAGDSSTLSINLEEAGGGKSVSERLTRLGSFRLLIDDIPQHMATTGFTDGLARLQACMGGMMAVTVPVTGPGDTAGKIELNNQIETMRVTSSGHETPLALAMPNLVPAGYRFVLDNVNPMTPISWQAGDDWVQVMRTALSPHGYRVVVDKQVVRIAMRESTAEPVVEALQTADAQSADSLNLDATEISVVNAIPPSFSDEIPSGVWAGAKGQNLSDVLEAWGLMSGVNVKVDLDGDYKLSKDVRFEGPFDEAVQVLLSQYSGADRPSGTFLGLSQNAHEARPVPAPVGAASLQDELKSTWRPSRERVAELRKAPARPSSKVSKSAHATEPMFQMPPIPDPANAPKTLGKSAGKSAAKVHKTKGEWVAMEGTSLRHVLESWGKEAGVYVVWQTEQSFPLVSSLKQQGSFEEAVGEALSQFAGQGVQPAAQLNQDPETGERALIIGVTRL